jgi:hypothetical protein
MNKTKAILDQLVSSSAFACPIHYQAEFEAAIASGDTSRIADIAEEIVQETCPRNLWPVLAHLMFRCSQGRANVGTRTPKTSRTKPRKKRLPTPSPTEIQPRADELTHGIDLVGSSTEDVLCLFTKSMADAFMHQPTQQPG